MNFGIEAKLFKGILEFTLDGYQEIRHNIIGYRTNVPANTGIEFSQLDNIGKSRSHGIDFSGKIQHAFNPDFWIILNGTFTYNKVVYKVTNRNGNEKSGKRFHNKPDILPREYSKIKQK